jgi:phenylpropionate dioxygenase-like ring-hydroxylating dioxygenase large terminal subunit
VTIAPEDLGTLVSLERGEIDRAIFSDADLFELEMDLIFGRGWLFLCHESQIRKPGDFFESVMGRDNVLVVRQKEGSIKALLNTCPHRGNAVCRAEEGNTKNFMCTYHGWTFDLAGNLVGVPGLTEYYRNELNLAAHGMRAVTQVDSYKGFIFGTHDESAPPLHEYLSETGRHGLDLLALQGDIEVVPGIQKFVIPCNWKFAVDNVLDWYHAQITHLSAITSGAMGPPPSEFLAEAGVRTPDGERVDVVGAASDDRRDSMVFLDHYGHTQASPLIEEFARFTPGVTEMMAWRQLPHAQEALGSAGARIVGHTSVFPTLWVSGPSNQVSLRIPRGVDETEIWWFTFVGKDWPDEIRQAVVFMGNHIFGPAGILEQEDGENWVQSTIQTRGLGSRRVPQLLKMNLGHGEVIRDGQSPPRIECTTSEHGQLWTYHAWQHWITGSPWPALRDATTPPERI